MGFPPYIHSEVDMVFFSNQFSCGWKKESLRIVRLYITAGTIKQRERESGFLSLQFFCYYITEAGWWDAQRIKKQHSRHDGKNLFGMSTVVVVVLAHSIVFWRCHCDICSQFLPTMRLSCERAAAGAGQGASTRVSCCCCCRRRHKTDGRGAHADYPQQLALCALIALALHFPL